MPYDSSLDEVVVHKVWESADTRINVSVYSYNKGPRKIQITRENKTGDTFRYTKLGRLTKEELTGVLPLLQEVSGQLD